MSRDGGLEWWRSKECQSWDFDESLNASNTDEIRGFGFEVVSTILP